ncbi:type II toxin-antitoxin system VapC family toxin [Microbacterium invictum]|uniref:PIN domain nuclease of toxin-antitoxin system n=1 Tax=Microbacterium invictum TaxID=515415 RepID=A0AA40SNU1_9MICO|nr:type II toxin-antitoxin system VapC family toxin [Microbacterium invictum]MBB4139611.1 PIN domain nuclease of toxin-antitoxin system [Microbacterium invictum]
MTSFLLDTHVWLWMLDDNPRLRGRIRAIVQDESSDLHLSAASLWEISIKMHQGRLRLAGSTEEHLRDRLRVTRVSAVPIDASDAFAAGALPHHHADPFDRMIVTHARALKVPLLTADPRLAAYDVETVMD